MKPIVNKTCKMCGGDMKIAGEKDGTYRLQCDCCGREEDFAPEGTVAPANAASGIYDKVIGGVVEIQVTNGRCLASGSGFFVSEGLIMTNRHVVTIEGRTVNTAIIKKDGLDYQGTVLCIGADVDLALIQVRMGLGKIMNFAEFGKVRNGDSVYVIGNSLGMGTCITSGIVSDRSRLVDGTPHLMTDAASNPGNSGGPVFDASGRVVGVLVSGIPSAKGMSFCIPANIAQLFLAKKGNR